LLTICGIKPPARSENPKAINGNVTAKIYKRRGTTTSGETEETAAAGLIPNFKANLC